MITKELVDRINELSRKQRSIGLTPDETDEQARLRQEYLAGFRANFKAVLDNVRIVSQEEYDQMVAEGKIPKPGGCGCGCGGDHGHGHGCGHDHGKGCSCKH